ncbi:hypothetical protein HY745_08395 [Candidatus Desantisbacteria bacterium]|nr:hypothetical protein [Candidatus Desantisbacteria bacterium]
MNSKLEIEILAKVDQVVAGMIKVEQSIKKVQTATEDTAKTSKGLEMDVMWAAVTSKIYLAEKAIHYFNVAIQQIEAVAKIQDMSDAFKNMTTAAGYSSTSIINDMKRVSAGIIEPDKLIQDANIAQVLGVQLDKISSILEMARYSARATGQDVNTMFNTIIEGIARQSSRMLASANIIVHTSDVVKEYAQSINKTVDELSEEEKQQAVLNAVLEKGAKLITNIGGESITTSEKVQGMKSSFADLWEELVKKTIPISSVMVGLLKDLADKAVDALYVPENTQEKLVAQKKALEDVLRLRIDIAANPYEGQHQSADMRSSELQYANEELKRYMPDLTGYEKGDVNILMSVYEKVKAHLADINTIDQNILQTNKDKLKQEADILKLQKEQAELKNTTNLNKSANENFKAREQDLSIATQQINRLNDELNNFILGVEKEEEQRLTLLKAYNYQISDEEKINLLEISRIMILEDMGFTRQEAEAVLQDEKEDITALITLTKQWAEADKKRLAERLESNAKFAGTQFKISGSLSTQFLSTQEEPKKIDKPYELKTTLISGVKEEENIHKRITSEIQKENDLSAIAESRAQRIKALETIHVQMQLQKIQFAKQYTNSLAQNVVSMSLMGASAEDILRSTMMMAVQMAASKLVSAGIDAIYDKQLLTNTTLALSEAAKIPLLTSILTIEKMITAEKQRQAILSGIGSGLAVAGAVAGPVGLAVGLGASLVTPMLSKDVGGTIPGYSGQPQIMIGHGQEVVLPLHRMSAQAAVERFVPSYKENNPQTNNTKQVTEYITYETNNYYSSDTNLLKKIEESQINKRRRTTRGNLIPSYS